MVEAVGFDGRVWTPPLSGYPVEWLLEDSKVPKAMWEPGVLKIDPSMPFLVATKPKPAGTFTAPGKPRALVWDPCRPYQGYMTDRDSQKGMIGFC